MKRINLFLILFVMTIGTGWAADPPPQLVITSVQVDFLNNLLHVNGKNFGSTPEVRLDDQVLTVMNPTAAKVDAVLPAGMVAGSYILRVSRGPSTTQNDVFDVTLGTVGPKGDKGDKGDVGPRGATGVQGLAGPKGDTGATGPATDAVREPFQKSFNDLFFNKSVEFSFFVPPGKRLVIEYVSVSVQMEIDDHLERIFLVTHAGGEQGRIELPLTVGQISDFNGVSQYVIVSQRVKLYCDPGSEIRVHLERNNAMHLGNSPISVTITGYVVAMN